MAAKSLALQANPAAGIKKKQATVGWELGGEDDDDEQLGGFGFKREKSECKLLQSQISVMQEIFDEQDRFQDGILPRAKYTLALRQDLRINQFIDHDAVKVAYSKRVLSLHDVLAEVEKDEIYEIS